jgi:Mg2+-importing ATPase
MSANEPMAATLPVLTISLVYMVSAECVKRIFYRRQRSKRHRRSVTPVSG